MASQVGSGESNIGKKLLLFKTELQKDQGWMETTDSDLKDLKDISGSKQLMKMHKNLDEVVNELAAALKKKKFTVEAAKPLLLKARLSLYYGIRVGKPWTSELKLCRD